MSEKQDPPSEEPDPETIERDRDEPVKIDLEPEEALRRLLRTKKPEK
ncbi:MAG: hypothetical protein WEC34_05825 [Acidimicrobiia bacterium]